jgi:hypothetical protein
MEQTFSSLHFRNEPSSLCADVTGDRYTWNTRGYRSAVLTVLKSNQEKPSYTKAKRWHGALHLTLI